MHFIINCSTHLIYSLNCVRLLGLYFNKAADSCDYTQNVLCNKKLSKPTTTTISSASSTTTTTTPASALFSTSRVPPKITAATSRTTFKITTTTEAYDVSTSPQHLNMKPYCTCVLFYFYLIF